jgi:hypothetical protein
MPLFNNAAIAASLKPPLISTQTRTITQEITRKHGMELKHENPNS